MKFEKEDTIEIGYSHNGFVLKDYFVEDITETGNNIYNSDFTVYEFRNDEEKRNKFIELIKLLAEKLDMNDKGNINVKITWN